MTRTNPSHRRTQDDATTDRPADGRALADVSHTHPYGDHGAINRPFQRGPTVVADGGHRDAVDEDEGVAEDEQAADESEDEPARTRLKDVDHTPPYSDGEEVDRVFERGGTEEPVANEE
ncbi:hypothetical protein [Halorussus litoreus]|uniref:hypothetical protein n=1 Tax=Halorussus litoreus TaxID=1710536 RepID=UPI001E5570CF|nr:hypothetical protein [Halorussus litoreus]